MNKIAFVTVSDFRLSKEALTIVNSIQSKYSSKEFDFFLVTDAKSIKKYRRVFLNSKIIFKNISETIKLKKFFSKKNLLRHTTIFTYLRLLIFDIVPELNTKEYKSIIYLDIDTFLSKKIPTKYLNSKENIAFVEQSGTPKELRQRIDWWRAKINNEAIFPTILEKLEKNMYFNAGVLIINNKEMFEELTKKIISYKVILDDQTMMNYFNINHFKIVNDNKMNNRVSTDFNKNSYIFHFAGSKKPWNKKDLIENGGELQKKCTEIGYF